MEENKKIVTIKDIERTFSEGKDLEIKKMLTLEESISFVDSVVTSCFIETKDEDGNILVQYSELYKEIGMFLYFPLFYVEGFSLEDISEENASEELYSFVIRNFYDITNTIHKDLSTQVQWEMLKNSIIKEVEFKKKMLIAKESNGYKIDSLINKISNVLSKIDISSLENFTENFANFFNQEQMNNDEQ